MSQNLSSAQNSIRDAYDMASEAYARKFSRELDDKPFDCELLRHFVSLVGTEEPVLDIGCGPGHTTAYLTALGLEAIGVDLSPNMVAQALALFPQSHFAVGDFFALPCEPESIAGIAAFYCIVHLTPEQLPTAFAEMFRVLRAGGVLLLSFHIGAETVTVANFLDTNAVLDFTFFEPEQVRTALRSAGFDTIDVRIREPYAVEHPTQRGYIFAHKA